MQSVILLLSGFFLGGVVVFFIRRHVERRHARPHELDPQYQPAVRAVLRYLRQHGTINIAQVERMLSVNGVVAMQYLDQMERDRFLKFHGHRGPGAFYTLA